MQATASKSCSVIRARVPLVCRLAKAITISACFCLIIRCFTRGFKKAATLSKPDQYRRYMIRCLFCIILILPPHLARIASRTSRLVLARYASTLMPLLILWRNLIHPSPSKNPAIYCVLTIHLSPYDIAGDSISHFQQIPTLIYKGRGFSLQIT